MSGVFLLIWMMGESVGGGSTSPLCSAGGARVLMPRQRVECAFRVVAGAVSPISLDSTSLCCKRAVCTVRGVLGPKYRLLGLEGGFCG